VPLLRSLASAAAAFAFVKKNPKKYQQIKRNISQKTSTLKRGATTVTRKFSTLRRTNTNLPTVANAPAYDFTYRADLANTLYA